MRLQGWFPGAWAGGFPERDTGQEQLSGPRASPRQAKHGVSFPPLSRGAIPSQGSADVPFFVPEPCDHHARCTQHHWAGVGLLRCLLQVAGALSLLWSVLPFVVIKCRFCCVAHLAEACLSGVWKHIRCNRFVLSPREGIFQRPRAFGSSCSGLRVGSEDEQAGAMKSQAFFPGSTEPLRP